MGLESKDDYLNTRILRFSQFTYRINTISLSLTKYSIALSNSYCESYISPRFTYADAKLG